MVDATAITMTRPIMICNEGETPMRMEPVAHHADDEHARDRAQDRSLADKDQPPTMMVAATASSSRPRPGPTRPPARQKGAARTPANAARAPIRMKAEIFTASTRCRNPRRLRAAADSENAKAEVCHRQDEPCDHRDDDEENELHLNNTKKIALPHELEGVEHAFGRAVADTDSQARRVPLGSSAAPRTMLSMPSVAIREGRRP